MWFPNTRKRGAESPEKLNQRKYEDWDSNPGFETFF